MSGSTIGGAVGAAVGFWVGGPQGAQWGWMIGSAVGGYVDPTQIEGPRLKDARTQTSRDGVVIPFGWGAWPCAGNIIWQQPDVTEHKQTERQGKGGPEVTSYTYTRSYAIGICEGPITGLLQIKRNGKLVYDARDDATLETEYTDFGLTTAQALAKITGMRADNAKFIELCTIYLGDETQNPDPTIESYLGVGNVPAYRGLAYIVVTDDDLTDMQGAIPQYEFVVVGEGDVNNSADPDYLAPGRLSEFIDADWPLAESEDSYTYVGYRKDQGLSSYTSYTADTINEILAYFADHYGESRAVGTYLGYGANTSGTNGLGTFGFSGTTAQPTVVDNQRLVLVYNEQVAENVVNTPALDLCPVIPYPGAFGVSSTYMDSNGVICFMEADDDPSAGTAYAAYEFYNNCNDLPDNGAYYPQIWGTEPVYIHVSRKRLPPREDLPDGAVAVPDAPGYYAMPDGSLIAGSGYVETSGTFKVLAVPVAGSVDSRLQYTQYEVGPALESSDPDYSNSTFWTDAYNDAVTAGDLPGGWTYGVQYPAVVSSVWTVSGLATQTLTPGSVLLSTIVAGLCDREGLDASEYDVTQLTDVVPGFRVANEGGADSAIGALMPAYFFDAAEWDGKIRFVKRGGASAFALTADDLAERDGDAFERERVQEAELLRRVTVGFIDPSAAYGPTTQKWERRAGTVQAKGEASMELPLTLDATSGATIAKRRGLAAWGEPEKQKFSLPYRLAALTPTDVGTYTDANDEVHTLRLMQTEDDTGIRYVESSTNSAEAYAATATAATPSGPTIPTGATFGPTILALMNLPTLRTTDANTLGIYVAVRGYLAGWPGCVLMMSADNGLSYQPVLDISAPATMGELTADVTDSGEPVSVYVYGTDTLSSVSISQIANGENAAAIVSSEVAEVLQFQTATVTTSQNYDLTDNTRGALDTTAAAHSDGDRFVLLNDAVKYLPLSPGLVGQRLFFKAVTNGTSADGTPASSIVFDPGEIIIDGGGGAL